MKSKPYLIKMHAAQELNLNFYLDCTKMRIGLIGTRQLQKETEEFLSPEVNKTNIYTSPPPHPSLHSHP